MDDKAVANALQSATAQSGAGENTPRTKRKYTRRQPPAPPTPIPADLIRPHWCLPNPHDGGPNGGPPCETFQELFDSLQAHAHASGFSIVKRQGRSKRAGVYQCYTVGCYRGGHRRSESKGIRNASSRLIGCEWQGVCANPVRTFGELPGWRFTLGPKFENQVHNHSTVNNETKVRKPTGRHSVLRVPGAPGAGPAGDDEDGEGPEEAEDAVQAQVVREAEEVGEAEDHDGDPAEDVEADPGPDQ